MAQKSINLDHSNGTISTTDDHVVRIGVKGALKVGTGENLDGTRGVPGAIRFRNSTIYSDASYEMYNGAQWQKLVQPVDPVNAIVYSIIFG